MILIFGNNEISLRLFPMMAFFGTLLFTFRVGKVLFNAATAFLSTAFVSLLPAMLLYSVEVKQYMVDACFTMLLFYLIVSLDLKNKSHLALIAVIGSIGILFSNVAIISLCACSIYLIVKTFRTSKNYFSLLPIMTWVFAFVFYYLQFVRHHPSAAHMKTYWADYFMPMNPFSSSFYTFLWSAIKDVYGNMLHLGDTWIAAFTIALISIFFMIKKKKTLQTLLLISPLIIHLTLSAFKLYPFNGRLILYLVPITALPIAYGIMSFSAFISSRKYLTWFPYFISALPLLLLFIALKKFPYEKEELKSTLGYVNGAGELVPLYVYHGAEHAMKYYMANGDAKLYKPIFGAAHLENPEAYLEEIRTIGDNYWIAFSHDCVTEKYGSEEKYIINTLSKSGAHIDTIFQTTGSKLIHAYYLPNN